MIKAITKKSKVDIIQTEKETPKTILGKMEEQDKNLIVKGEKMNNDNRNNR